MANKNLPGTDGKCFHLKLTGFNKGDILQSHSKGTKVIVVKVYKNTWWRRLLLWVGFKVRILEVKLKPYKDERGTITGS